MLSNITMKFALQDLSEMMQKLNGMQLVLVFSPAISLVLIE
jgi:hypothetical protein